MEPCPRDGAFGGRLHPQPDGDLSCLNCGHIVYRTVEESLGEMRAAQEQRSRGGRVWADRPIPQSKRTTGNIERELLAS